MVLLDKEHEGTPCFTQQFLIVIIVHDNRIKASERTKDIPKNQ